MAKVGSNQETETHNNLNLKFNLTKITITGDWMRDWLIRKTKDCRNDKYMEH